MTFRSSDPPPRLTCRTANVPASRGAVPVTFIDFSHIAWDGHDLVVISKYDVILD